MKPTRPTPCTLFMLTSGVLFFLLFPAASHALAADSSLSATELYYRAIWGLLIVTGSILIIYGLVRKRFSILATAGDKHIQITEIKPLMGKKALCLVEVKGQEFLIGLTGDSITHLATLNPDRNSFANTLKCTQEQVEGQ